MTGFARHEGGDDVMTWVWEVKSVNGRNLDLRLRLPQGFEALEAEVRKLVPEHLARGNVQIARDQSTWPIRITSGISSSTVAGLDPRNCSIR